MAVAINSNTTTTGIMGNDFEHEAIPFIATASMTKPRLLSLCPTLNRGCGRHEPKEILL
jgi:hypothetical protein